MAGKVIDYTRMELGRVTRTWKGRPVASIARCAKCGRRGERSVYIPKKDGARSGARPYVSWYHKAHVAGVGGFRFMSIDENCSVSVDKTTAEDLLTVEERREYDAHVAELRAWVDSY